MTNGETRLDAGTSDAQERSAEDTAGTGGHKLSSEAVLQLRAELLQRFDRVLLQSASSQLDFLPAAAGAFIKAFHESFGNVALEEISIALANQRLAPIASDGNSESHLSIMQRLQEYITNPIS